MQSLCLTLTPFLQVLEHRDQGSQGSHRPQFPEMEGGKDNLIKMIFKIETWPLKEQEDPWAY